MSENDYAGAISKWTDSENTLYKTIEVLKVILQGFEVGIFVRNVDSDAESGWLIRLLPYIQALKEASELIAKAEGGDK